MKVLLKSLHEIMADISIEIDDEIRGRVASQGISLMDRRDQPKILLSDYYPVLGREVYVKVLTDNTYAINDEDYIWANDDTSIKGPLHDAYVPKWLVKCEVEEHPERLITKGYQDSYVHVVRTLGNDIEIGLIERSTNAMLGPDRCINIGIESARHIAEAILKHVAYHENHDTVIKQMGIYDNERKGVFSQKEEKEGHE